jgi:uncharacterized protein (DUF433 family)
MGALNWSQCPAVESVPDRRSGAWVFRDTRMQTWRRDLREFAPLLFQ